MPQERNYLTQLRGLTDRLLGRELLHDSSPVYVFPNSPHFFQYYTPEFYSALSPEHGPQIEAVFNSLLRHAHTRSIDYAHAFSPDSAGIKQQGFSVESSGAATIIRERLWVKGGLDKLRRSVLISTTDLLLGGFYGKRDFSAIDFGGDRFLKSEGLPALNRRLRNLEIGDTFDLIASDRTAQAQLLPMPSDPEFVKPWLYLIGARETKDFPRVISQARKKGNGIVVHVKRTHLGLGLAYLEGYNPDSVTIDTEEAGTIPVQETGMNVQRTQKGQLHFIVRPNDGYVDELVRDDKKAPRESGIEDYFGIDIVQTGDSIRKHGLKPVEPVISVAAYPLKITVQ